MRIFDTDIPLDSVDWHRDYATGYRWTLERFDKIKLIFDMGNDVKFPWELSRFQFGPPLGLMYRTTGDPRYPALWGQLVKDWMEENPFLHGVNWYCTMEVAIRAANWVIAASYMDRAMQGNPHLLKALTKSLILHAHHIETFPEFLEDGRTTNHTTADFAGLLLVSQYLGGYRKAAHWRDLAVHGLVKCMEEQVYEDGMDFEGSIAYHRLVLEIFGYAALLCRGRNIELPHGFLRKLFRMFECTAAYTDHLGNAPQMGDNDSGRFLILEDDPRENNHRYLLDLGERLFDYRFRSQSPDRSRTFRDRLPPIEPLNTRALGIEGRSTDTSVVFQAGGLYLLKNEEIACSVAAFPCGQSGRGGHNHKDTFSFTLSFKGHPIVVDPGTSTYTRSRKRREAFRSTAVHNTVQLGDLDLFPSPDDDRWAMPFSSKVDVREVSFASQCSQLTLSHRYFPHTEVIRTVKVKSDRVQIIDRIHTSLDVIPRSSVLLAPDLEQMSSEHPSIAFHKEGQKWHLVVCSVGRSHLDLVPAMYSPSYGVESHSLRFVVRPTGPLRPGRYEIGFSLQFVRSSPMGQV